MPWTCPSCGKETDLGYNICWTCRAPRPGTESPEQKACGDILVTTTTSLETHHIDEYFGPVFGEIIYGSGMMRDFFASITDTSGGRSADYESLLTKGRTDALNEMC